jgi:hypothetical protein
MVMLEERITIPKPPGGGSPGGLAARTRFRERLDAPGYHDTQMRTAVKGACLNLAAGVALGIFQQKFKAYMLSELEHMPKPPLDRTTAKDFFTNPKNRNAMQVIDVLTKHTGSFSSELAEHHMTVIGTSVLELTVLRVASVSDEERLEFLSGLQDELDAYDENLRTIEDNVQAAQQLSGRALDAAKGAEDLTKMMDHVLVLDWMIKQGFSLDEAVQIYTNLQNYASRVRGAFERLDRLHDQVTRQRYELATLSSEANKYYWQTIFRIAARKQQMTEQVLPAAPTMWEPAAGTPATASPARKTQPTPTTTPKTITVAPLR